MTAPATLSGASGALRAALAQRDSRQAYLAHHDGLTALPNCLLFPALLEQSLELARRKGHKLAVFVLQLDRIWQVRDTLGPGAADDLLQVLAQRLRRRLRREDTVARLADDQFAAIVNDAEAPTMTARLAHKIVHALSVPVPLHEREIVVACSIGISLFPDDGDSATSLLRAADQAAGQSGNGARNAFHFHSTSAMTEVRRQMALEASLRRALAHQQFELHYQPRVALASGRIAGVAVLLRWRDPQRGLLLPDELLAEAEHSGLIVALGRWMLDAALAQCAKWSEQGLPPLPLSLCLSERYLMQADLADQLEAAWHSHCPQGVCLALQLDVKEAMLPLLARSADALVRLQQAGLGIAVDEFGTSHDSLTRLRQYAVGTLRIGQAFIRDIPAAADNLALLRAVIGMAHGAGLKVLAERVDSDQQRDCLRQLGCDFAQGPAVCGVLDAAAMSAMLEAQGGVGLVDDDVAGRAI